MLCGMFNGYFSARIYKSAEGSKWYETSLFAALLFPSVVFGAGFCVNLFIWYYGSSVSVMPAPFHVVKQHPNGTASIYLAVACLAAAYLAVVGVRLAQGALPFGTMMALLCLWFGISVPLVLAGGYFGFRKDALSFPVSVNQIPRQIPEQPYVNGRQSATAAATL